MNVPIEFLAIFLTAVLAALGGLFTYVMNEIKGVGKTLTGILDHLAKLNGRHGKSETWQAMHESQDDERHEGLEREQTRLWTAIDRGRLSS